MRMAWNVRVAGWMRLVRLPAGVRRDEARELPRRRERRRRARADDRGRDLPRARLLAVAEQHVGELLLRARPRATRRPSGRCARFIRMSKGPSCAKLKPRCGSSSCGEETPRSKRIAGQAALAEPRCCDGGEVFEAGVLDARIADRPRAARERQPPRPRLCPKRVTVPVIQAAPISRRYARRVRRSHRRTNRHPATTNLRALPGAARADVQVLWSPAVMLYRDSDSSSCGRPACSPSSSASHSSRRLLQRSSFQSSNLLP